jgi:hypothetical protein
MGPNQFGILLEKLSEGQNNVAQVAMAGSVLGIGAIGGGPEPARMPAGFNGVTCIEHNSKGGNVIASVAVAERVGPRGVGGQHSSYGALGAARRIGSKPATYLGQLRIQLSVNDAGLHANCVASDFQDGPKMRTQIHDQAGAEGLSRHAAARSSRNKWDLVLCRVSDQTLNVFFIPRDNDPERLHLKDAGVRAVQCASQVVKKELAFEDAAKVILQVLPLLFVHHLPAGSQPAAHPRFEVGVGSD